MGENKGQTIFLSVIGIATLLVAIIGATFAYFTTSMAGDAANVTATTAKVGAVSFTAEGVTADNTKILPGWTSGPKNVTVTLGESDYPVDYTCSLSVTSNGITDLKLAVSGDGAIAEASKTIGTEATTIQIASGTLTSGTSKSMTYTLTFPETGVEQNAQQNKTINATVSCATSGSTVYYNNAHPNGTTELPTKE